MVPGLDSDVESTPVRCCENSLCPPGDFASYLQRSKHERSQPLDQHRGAGL